MCVIASIPAGKDINNDTIDRMWKRNPDGGGISWIEDGKVQVFKTMKLKPFKQKFKEVLSKYGDSDILVHMRIATHGSVCIENNHPFYIDTQTVFAHNGIMPNEFHPPAKSDLSDTRYFNKVFLQNMKPIALDDELFRTAIGDIIGMGNKLVILSANKKLKQDSYIINEHMGQWVKGVWYSNTAHIPSKGVKYDKTGATIGGYTQRSWNAYDGVFEAVDDSCEIEIAPDVDSSWFDEEQSFNDEYWWCETIPEEELEKESVQEEIAEFLEAAEGKYMYQYETFDDCMADFAIHYDGGFRCCECGLPVTAEAGKVRRDCDKECTARVFS